MKYTVPSQVLLALPLVISSALAAPQRGVRPSDFSFGGPPQTSSSAATAAATAATANAAAPTTAAATTAAATSAATSVATATHSRASSAGNGGASQGSATQASAAETTAAETSAAPHSAVSGKTTGVSGASATSSGASASSTASGSSSGKKCITFTADDESWYFANTGVWGSQTGTFSSAGGQICVPYDSSAGGAMYVGTEANPAAGNTKIECYLPSATGQGNCDISLVDGYSLSVQCKAGGKAVGGGTTNLWSSGKTCSDTSGSICKNSQGYSAAQSDVSAFFQEGIEGGNEYCIWVNCTQDYYFSGDSDLSCHVSGGKS